MKKTAALLCVATALILGACSKTSPPVASTSASPAQTASPTPVPTPCVLSGGDTKDKVKDVEGTEFSSVADVRPNGVGCPRVVFEFADKIPNYTVRYDDGPFSECGSGAEVNTKAWDATAFITVKLTPSGSVDQKAKPTYTGPRDMEVRSDTLKHLRSICDFEADFQWVIGLDAQHPFKVTTFDDPSRLVIDISEN